MAHSSTVHSTPGESKIFNPIRWLVHLDSEYREAQKLKSTENRLLEDMGIPAQQADANRNSRSQENQPFFMQDSFR